MSKARERNIWGRQPTASQDADVEVVDKRCRLDLKFLVQHILHAGQDEYKRALGAFHDFFFDFLRLEELRGMPKWARHSVLSDYLPEKLDDGCWPERWIWFPTLAAKPVVQDGPTCDLSRDFHDGKMLTEDRAGILFRIAGNGRWKYDLLPRGLLKTSIGSRAFAIQEIIRDPSVRILIRSGEEDLPAKILNYVRAVFESNETFTQLYGHLTPDRHETEWNRTALQVRTETRRGADPTLSAFGIRSNVTGAHGDVILLDDIVTKQNVDQQSAVREKIREAAFVGDRGFRLLGHGTLYREDDAHSLFIRPGGGGYDNTSIMVASVLDSDGRSIWPEWLVEREIALKRSMVGNDSFWFSQMWNNPYLAAKGGFAPEWITYYDGRPEDIARDKQLDILITCDPNCGKSTQADFTGCVCQGQTPDGQKRYILDGFHERLDETDFPMQFISLCAKWQEIANKTGTSFRCGIERGKFLNSYRTALEYEMRSRSRSFHVMELMHGNRPKEERVAKLFIPYSHAAILWPRQLERINTDGRRYDLVDHLRNEFYKYPACHVDLLDAEAYGEEILRPLVMSAAPPAAAGWEREEHYRRNNTPIKRGPGGGRYVPAGVAAAAREGIYHRTGVRR
jgi:hypothetical protein